MWIPVSLDNRLKSVWMASADNGTGSPPLPRRSVRSSPRGPLIQCFSGGLKLRSQWDAAEYKSALALGLEPTSGLEPETSSLPIRGSKSVFESGSEADLDPLITPFNGPLVVPSVYPTVVAQVTPPSTRSGSAKASASGPQSRSLYRAGRGLRGSVRRWDLQKEQTCRLHANGQGLCSSASD
jgi:hypothetical protein